MKELFERDTRQAAPTEVKFSKFRADNQVGPSSLGPRGILSDMLPQHEDAKVIVVDDIPSARQVLFRLLRQLGFRHIEEASNGADALEQLRATSADLVIADAEMPVMTGVELLKEIRKAPEFENLPFILTAPHATKEDVIAAYNSGVTKFLIKPFSVETLKRVLGEIIEAAE